MATPEPSVEFANLTDSELDTHTHDTYDDEEIEEEEESEEMRFDNNLNRTPNKVDISKLGSAAQQHSDDDDFDF